MLKVRQYTQIKEYVWNKFELKVSTLYIAQIKRKCGIELREHYNKSKKEKQIIPQCTPEKKKPSWMPWDTSKWLNRKVWLLAFKTFMLGIGTAIIPFLQGIN